MVATMEAKSSRASILARARQARTGAVDSINTIESGAQNRLSRLDPARRASVLKRLADMPQKHRGAYLRAVGGRSPASGIKAFCSECVGWQRCEVAACTALACPLWGYRPFQADRRR
jgi:hypothetical protein